MATPTTDKLRAYYPSKYLSADGGTLTQRIADAGCTARTIVDAGLTEADDYWNGAVGWFDGSTTTAALRAQFFHVKDFDAATDTLTLARDLCHDQLRTLDPSRCLSVGRAISHMDRALDGLPG